MYLGYTAKRFRAKDNATLVVPRAHAEDTSREVEIEPSASPHAVVVERIIEKPVMCVFTSLMDLVDNLNDKRRMIFLERTSAVIGYKRAIFLGPVAPRPFRGVVGSEYGVQSHSENRVGFHMHRGLWGAQYHPQEGNVYLEVTGYGVIDVDGLGYVTTQQRVVQIIVDTCGRPKCKYPASVWDGSTSLWLCDRHGRTSTPDSGSPMSFEQVEKTLEETHGHRVAVRSIATPRKWGFWKRHAQKSVLPKFVPVTELVAQSSPGS